MRLKTTLMTSLVLCLFFALAVGKPAEAQMIPSLGGSAAADDKSGETTVTVDPVQLLLDILQDEGARARLVEQLQAAEAPEENGAAAASDTAEERPTIGGRIAATSQAIAQSAAAEAGRLWAVVSRLPGVFSGINGDELGALLDASRTLLLTIGATVAVFLALRALAIPVYRRIGAGAADRPALQRVGAFIGAGLMDFAIVLVSWGIGYIVALTFFDHGGTIDFNQILYLNAFLVVEFVKALVRLLLSPSTMALRPINLSDRAARRLYRVIRIVTSIMGYGLLLILPFVVQEAGYSQARSTAAVIWIVLIVYLVAAVLRFRRPVGGWLLAQTHGPATSPEADAGAVEGDTSTRAAREGPGKSPRILRGIAYAWYWVALAWLGWLFLAVLDRRQGSVGELLTASGKVALALAAALIASGALGKLTQRGIWLPQSVTDRVPLLETRLNRYVPRILLALRLLIVAAFVFYAFDTLQVLSAGSWMASQLGLRVTGIVFSVAVIVLLAFAIWLAMTSWVDYRLNPTYGAPTAREQTLLTLLRNAATIAILLFALMFVLSEVGLNIGPLLASAGVVGLAIGFGAQKMVQDIITGIFIQFENAINVGDVITAGGTTGAVERLTVRSVSLRDLSGIYHIIPFSSVDTVSNYTRDFSYYVIDMGVAYRENVPEVKQAMHDAFQELRSNPEQGAFILGDLEWFGVDAFGDNAVVVKCRIKTWPAKQWGVGRAYNEIVKQIFDERGIEIPFPQQTTWFGEDKAGNAPPMRVTGQVHSKSETVDAARATQSGATSETPQISAPSDDGPPSDPD